MAYHGVLSDYDKSPKFEGFMNLAHDTKMIYDAPT